jgi:hypothetical protein
MEIIIKAQSTDHDTIYRHLSLSPAALLSALWNAPQKNTSPTAMEQMTLETAQYKLEKHYAAKKPGPIKLQIKHQKHKKTKRAIGLTLIGFKEAHNCIWHQATIDEKVFMKTRNNLISLQKLLIDLQEKNELNSPHSPITDAALIAAHHDLGDNFPLKQPPKQAKPPESPPAEKSTIADKPELPLSQPPTFSLIHKISWMLRQPATKSILLGLGCASIGQALNPLTGIAFLGILSLTSSASFLLQYSYLAWQKNLKLHYQFIKNKNIPELAQLEITRLNALKAGIEAQHWAGWRNHLFYGPAWKHYSTYRVGLQCANNKELSLLENLAKLPSNSL